MLGHWELCLAALPTAFSSYSRAVTKAALWFLCFVLRLGALRSVLQVLFLRSVSVHCIQENAKGFHLLCCIKETTKVFSESLFFEHCPPYLCQQLVYS